MTFGNGGHTKEILKQAPEVKLFCLDRDPVAYERAVVLAEMQCVYRLANNHFIMYIIISIIYLLVPLVISASSYIVNLIRILMDCVCVRVCV